MRSLSLVDKSIKSPKKIGQIREQIELFGFRARAFGKNCSTIPPTSFGGGLDTENANLNDLNKQKQPRLIPAEHSKLKQKVSQSTKVPKASWKGVEEQEEGSGRKRKREEKEAEGGNLMTSKQQKLCENPEKLSIKETKGGRGVVCKNEERDLCPSIGRISQDSPNFSPRTKLRPSRKASHIRGGGQ